MLERHHSAILRSTFRCTALLPIPMSHVGTSSMEDTREPSRNCLQVGLIALTKLVAERWFLDENHKQMNHSPYQQSISKQQERAKEDGLPDHYRKNSQIHRIANPLIGSRFDKEDRRIKRR